MKLKCVIFDCDGVLVDSIPLSVKVLIQMAREQGLDLDYTFAFQRFSGGSLSSSLDYIENKIGKALPKSFAQDYRKRTYEIFRKEIKPIDGVNDALNKLELPFCVASSGPVEKIRLNLTKTDLIQHFEGKIFSAYEIKRWKPDPGIFLHAAKNMGFKPNECLVIEDSIDGVEAAISGGFQVMGFTPALNHNILTSFNIPLFSDMQLLPALIEEINS